MTDHTFRHATQALVLLLVVLGVLAIWVGITEAEGWNKLPVLVGGTVVLGLGLWGCTWNGE